MGQGRHGVSDETFGGDEYIHYLIVVMVTQVYKLYTLNILVHCIANNCIIYQLFHNRVVKKREEGFRVSNFQIK